MPFATSGSDRSCVISNDFKGEVIPMNIQGTNKALVAEFLGSIALPYAVLNVVTTKGTKEIVFWLTTSFTVFASGSKTGAYSAVALNPAVAIIARYCESLRVE